jgi:hypothetical protein
MSEKLLERVGALLAKAESTDSEHEADALVAKAQQLATLHAIDLAAARERSAQAHRRQVPEQRKVVLGRPRQQGLRHRVQLYTVVARVNDVRVDVARNSTYVLVFGFTDDLDVVEKLTASLATQMAAAANAAIRRGEHREEVYWSPTAQAWRSDARVFRTAFSSAFVATVHTRLQAARQAALEQDRRRRGEAAGASTSGALVLARKEEEVAAYYAERSTARGTYRAGGTSVAFSVAGHAAGAAAGRRARLTEPGEVGGARGELG